MKRFFIWDFVEGVFVYTLMIHQVFAQGLFWQIDAPDRQPSYLFGTIPSGEARVIQLLSKIDPYFKQARSVSLEMLMDIPTLQNIANIMLLEKETSLDKLIGNSLYLQVLQALHPYKISESMAKRLKPWAVATILRLPPVTGEYLDAILYKRAMELRIPPYGLSKVEEQFEAFEKLSLREQLVLLEASLRSLNDLPHFFNRLHELYLQGDLSAMMALNQNHILAHRSGPDGVETFYQHLIEDRNMKRVNRLLPRLQEGNTFIVIGVLSLPGERGLLRLLQNLGYRVKILE